MSPSKLMRSYRQSAIGKGTTLLVIAEAEGLQLILPHLLLLAVKQSRTAPQAAHSMLHRKARMWFAFHGCQQKRNFNESTILLLLLFPPRPPSLLLLLVLITSPLFFCVYRTG